jgi:single-strand DNA-binding protein
MADGMNIVIVAGNLSRDPELRFGNGPESAVLKFSVAANESYFDKRSNERKESVEFIDCTVFGKRAEALQKILSKGTHVTVRGKWHTSSWEKDGQKRYRTECVVDSVVLGGRGNGASGGGAPRERPRFDNNPAPGGDDSGAPDGADDGDSIPF